MNWEQIKTWFDNVSNHPLTITIVFVLCCFACALYIFSKTSIGRKAINKAIALHEKSLEKANNTLDKVKDVENLANEKIDSLKAFYEEKIAVVVSLFNFYIESLFALLELVPNAKVQNALVKVKEEYQVKKEEITSVVGAIYQDYSLELENKEKLIRKEYEDKIAYLEQQVENVKLYLTEIKEECDNGEREETTDSNSTEEEIQGD